MNNFQQTLYSQFANSPILVALLSNINDYIDPLADYQTFFDSVMNIDTASGYGLDVWGRIVGLANGRVVQIPFSPHFFGFEEVGYYEASGFNESTSDGKGRFYNGVETLLYPYSLPDTQFRQIILIKAMYNICNGSIPAINALLMSLFPGRGNAWVQDNGDMRLAYVFSFVLTDVEYAIVTQANVLPKPVGVSSTVVVNP